MGFMSMTVALSTTVWLDSSVTARVQGQWIAHCSPMTRVLPGAMEDGMGDPLFFFSHDPRGWPWSYLLGG